MDATLNSGQAFRWQWRDGGWEGVIESRWVRLKSVKDSIAVQTAVPIRDWSWLTTYLQSDVDLASVVAAFPQDSHIQAAVGACRGLRLLRQDRWECLASFILSSSKQIRQIQQIVPVLCERYGRPISVPRDCAPVYSFPTADRIAACSESDLRACKMGFRAPFLLETARLIAEGEIDLTQLHKLELDEARQELLRLPGVGNKIANCVLLFACDFYKAFPIDVWIMKALGQLYFPKRQLNMRELQHFADDYFGPYAGYAQQYLYHYMRIQNSSSAINARRLTLKPGLHNHSP